MSVTIESGDLAAAMKRAAAIVASRNTIPILANVRIEAKAGELEIVTTDLDLEYRETIAVVDGGGLKTTVEAKRLAPLLGAAAKGSQVKLEIDGAHLVVKAGRSRWRLPVIGVEDFPQMPTADLPARLTIKAKVFAEMIGRVFWSRSTEPSRYYMHGPLMHDLDGKLALAATNGHTLMRISGKSQWPVGAPQIILQPKFCQAVQSIAAESDGDALIEWDGPKIRFQIGPITLLAKTIDGVFPDYQRVIPGESSDPIVVDPEVMRAAVKRVDLIGNAKTRCVRVSRGDGILSVSAVADDGARASEEFQAEVTASFEAGFNSQYVDQMLSAMGGDSITIHHAEANAQARICRTVDDGALGVLMPMRI